MSPGVFFKYNIVNIKILTFFYWPTSTVFLINSCFSSSSINAKQKLWDVPHLLHMCAIFSVIDCFESFWIGSLCKNIHLRRYGTIKTWSWNFSKFPGMFILGKYVKISFKSRVSPYYILSSRGQKIKNITEIERKTFCFQSWCHFLCHFSQNLCSAHFLNKVIY